MSKLVDDSILVANDLFESFERYISHGPTTCGRWDTVMRVRKSRARQAVESRRSLRLLQWETRPWLRHSGRRVDSRGLPDLADPTERFVVKGPAQDIGAEFSTGLLRVHCFLLTVFLKVIFLFNRSRVTSPAHECLTVKTRGLKKCLRPG